jgi:hypothetical protein
MAEHWLNTRTSMNRHEQAGRKARAAAQARVRKRGATFRLLLGISHVMMLDVALFGRLRSGPFFALIKKTHAATR